MYHLWNPHKHKLNYLFFKASIILPVKRIGVHFDYSWNGIEFSEAQNSFIGPIMAILVCVILLFVGIENVHAMQSLMILDKY